MAASGALIRSRGVSGLEALAAPAKPATGRRVPVHLVAAERPAQLPCFAGVTLPMWTFSQTWLPVIRINLGDEMDVALDNRLPRADEHVTVHWHGIRLPNDQDGVPFLVQPPVMPGDSFRYRFVAPDTGTFFFHTHCNTSEQIGRGLAGVLIVEGDATKPYAADRVILLRDWLVDFENRSFRNFVTKRGAARAGTFGNLRSANGAAQAEIRLPSSADCRLRIVNGDPTRVMELAVDAAEAAVIAIDGIAVPPFALGTWQLGPAMRLDLVVRAPAEGGLAYLVDRRPEVAVPLARLVGVGPAQLGTAFDPAPLRAGRIPEPRIADAERLTFVFAQSSEPGSVIAINDVPGALLLGSLCISSDDFWTINGTAWPGRDHSTIPAPLAVLERNRSYVFMLRNDSKLIHPIHIHGHTFLVLRSDKRVLPVHHADTVLLLPEETIEVAFVADNPGRWMFHCHVIEHQETGMMAYLEVA